MRRKVAASTAHGPRKILWCYLLVFRAFLLATCKGARLISTSLGLVMLVQGSRGGHFCFALASYAESGSLIQDLVIVMVVLGCGEGILNYIMHWKPLRKPTFTKVEQAHINIASFEDTVRDTPLQIEPEQRGVNLMLSLG